MLEKSRKGINMKIRSGFVSNSSSSSFCILGLEITNEQYDNIYANKKTIEDKQMVLDLETSVSYEDGYFAGMYPARMKDDETLGQFKQRIVEGFKLAGMEVQPTQLDWYEDGGYNG